MTAPELRSFVRTVLDGLDDDQRTTITESLVTRATQGHAGWGKAWIRRWLRLRYSIAHRR
jgi:hypothetical protein